MKSFFEETGGIYRREEDYQLPNRVASEPIPIGIWGQRRRRYLWEHRNGIYTGMLLAGTLNDHLEQIDAQAQELLSRIISELATAEHVTENLKATDQMEWVRRMNNIRSRAVETVYKELIYA